MNCWHCNTDLIWGGDHDYEDYSYEGEGIVTNLSCPNEDCGVELVLVYSESKPTVIAAYPIMNNEESK
tara:strand:+ start:417 stop:620 length:204 start_codon:yes stop_codon:yes gene_type:complete